MKPSTCYVSLTQADEDLFKNDPFKSDLPAGTEANGARNGKLCHKTTIAEFQLTLGPFPFVRSVLASLNGKAQLGIYATKQ